MATATAKQLREQIDAAFGRLTRLLAGMEPYLDRSDAPGEWTTRELLSHLLHKPDSDFVALLKSFATTNLPLVEVDPGATYLDAERRRWPLATFVKTLDARRQAVGDYLDSLSEADLARKARIPLFKAFKGTDEITIPVFVGAVFGFHWNDHAGQIAKIRKAVGLPDAA